MNRSRIMIFAAAGFAGALAVAGIAVASPERREIRHGGEIERESDSSSTSDSTATSQPDENELEPNDGVGHEANDGVGHEAGEDANDDNGVDPAGHDALPSACSAVGGRREVGAPSTQSSAATFWPRK